MIYAHIYEEHGRFNIHISRWTKYASVEEEIGLGPLVVASFFEETGDQMLILKKVADFAVRSNLPKDKFTFPVDEVLAEFEHGNYVPGNREGELLMAVRKLSQMLGRAMHNNFNYRTIIRHKESEVCRLEAEIQNHECGLDIDDEAEQKLNHYLGKKRKKHSRVLH